MESCSELPEENSPAWEIPSPDNAAAWARMLAAARLADQMRTDGVRGLNKNPRARTRLYTLFPVLRELYDEFVRSILQPESEHIDALLGHCWRHLPTMELPSSIHFKRGANEPWSKAKCRKEVRTLHIPVLLDTLQPVTPDMLGILLLPRTPGWRSLRNAISNGLDADALVMQRYRLRTDQLIRKDVQRESKPLQLYNVPLVDAVVARAPLLVRALPSRWTSPDNTDGLIEALLALLQLGNTRPLADPVNALLENEFRSLVSEHACLSEVLANGAWRPECENERNIDEYREFARFLQSDSRFKGQLADLPTEPEAAIGPSDYSKPGFSSYGFPLKSNTAAWVRMLAAARGADKIKTEGLREIDADPLTRARLGTLLPLTRALYDKHVRKTAQTQSDRIEAMLGHCKAFFPPRKPPFSKPFERGAREPWSEELCEENARKLLVPFTLKTLRPVSPNAIGCLLTPRSSAWRLLRNEINRKLKPPERLQKAQYSSRMSRGFFKRFIAKSKLQQPLRKVRLVHEVLLRAPALVRALPPQWSSPDKTDELHRALLRLLQGAPLAHRSETMSQTEYDYLEMEHLCLSRLLYQGKWEPSCETGRSLGDYTALVRILQKDGGSEDLMETAPLELTMATESREDSPSSEAASLAEDSCTAVSSRSTRATAEGPLSGAASKYARVAGESPVLEKWEHSPDELLELSDEDDQDFCPRGLADPAETDPVELLWTVPQLPIERASPSLVDVPHGIKIEPYEPNWGPSSRTGELFARRATGELLARRATAVSGVSAVPIVPLVFVGAVAALGLVLLLVAVAFRLGSGRNRPTRTIT